MYVIPLLPCLRAARPDKNNLFHLVMNLSELHRGWLLLLLYSFVSSVCVKESKERQSKGGRNRKEEKILENQLISHPEVAAVCHMNV